MATKDKILTYIQSQKKLVTRRDIIEELSITTSRNSIYQNISKLLEEGILVEYSGKRLGLSSDPHTTKLRNQTGRIVEWDIPTFLRLFQHDSQQMPLINLAQHKTEDFKKVVTDIIVPKYGFALSKSMMIGLIILQFVTDNEGIFQEMYPELPFDESIKEAAEEQLNDLLRRLN